MFWLRPSRSCSTPSHIQEDFGKRIFVWTALIAISLLFSTSARALVIDGKVVDATTKSAIADAIVTLGDKATTSDASGSFHVDGSAAEVFARAPGYRASAVPVSRLTSPGSVVSLTPFEPNALYLTVYGVASKTLRGGALSLIRDGDANALVIDIKGDRGLVDYPSSIPLATAVGARRVTTIPNLAALVKSLHDSGVYAIARIVVFKDDPLASHRPDLAVKRKNGELFRDREGLSWTDPFQREVWDYNIAIAVEAARAGFDEIQFDYVRFPDSAQAALLARPATQGARVEAIAGFLRDARRQLAPYNVFTAVDFFGYVSWNLNDTGIGQRLVEIAQSTDYLSPMLYPSGFQYGIPGYKNPVTHPYEIVRLSLEQARHRLGISPKRFRPWLQIFRDYAFDRRAFDADELAAQIRATKDFGSNGWMLWNARNVYDDLRLARAVHSVTRDSDAYREVLDLLREPAREHAVPGGKPSGNSRSVHTN